MVNRILEITFVLIILYLIVNNYQGFGSVVRSVGSVYNSSVKTLQGR